MLNDDTKPEGKHIENSNLYIVLFSLKNIWVVKEALSEKKSPLFE